MVAALLIASLCPGHSAQSVTLAWNASSDATVSGYKVRYGTTSGNPNQTVTIGKVTTATVSSLNDATTYYFTVVAYNPAGLESQPSNQISYRTPGQGSTTYVLTVNSGTGDGSYAPTTQVAVNANPAPAGQEFETWTGDYQILANPSSAATTATMPSDNATITATYGSVSSADRIRYYPRSDFNGRMVGGVFEGTNGNPSSGNYTTIHTVTDNPPLSWSDVGVSLGNYRYLRYRAPRGSYGNVAEIEFYRNGSKLTGSSYGTSGSWNGGGTTFDKAFDGNINTFFDAANADGNYTGIDTGNGGSSETTSIWPNTAVPQVVDSGADQPVELGVKFRSDVAGTITGIRFYKSAANNGPHVGNLWTSTGTRLATATFTGETNSGWQQVNFATPVPISANTVYVASYHSNSGHYSIDSYYFSASSGEDNPPLHALSSSSSNGNGVFTYASNSAFPDDSWHSCNYWVDVVFVEGPQSN